MSPVGPEDERAMAEALDGSSVENDAFVRARVALRIATARAEGAAEQRERDVSIVEYSVTYKQDREKTVARIRGGHAQHTNVGRNDDAGA